MDESSLPILDRIMTAGRTLGVSRREIASEMQRLHQENDIAGMQSLFNAYKNWELRERLLCLKKSQKNLLFVILIQLQGGGRWTG